MREKQVIIVVSINQIYENLKIFGKYLMQFSNFKNKKTKVL